MKTKTRFHKLTAWLLTLAMLMTFMPSFTLSASAAETYDLWVGGEQFTDEKLEIIGGEGKATYNPENNTLTLNGYTYTGESYGWDDGDYGAAIYYGGSETLKLELKNTNSVTYSSDASKFGYGVYAKGSITVSGDGTLTAVGGEGTDHSYGVYAEGSITVSGGTLNVVGGEATYRSYGVCAEGSITVSDGSLTATGTTGNAVQCLGITVTGGSLTANSTSGYAVQCYGNITVTGGSLTVNTTFLGAVQCSGNGNITVTGGSLTANSTVYCYGKIALSGGEVLVQGGPAFRDYSGFSCENGYYCDAEDGVFSLGTGNTQVERSSYFAFVGADHVTAAHEDGKHTISCNDTDCLLKLRNADTDCLVEYIYTADDNIITATCSANCGYSGTAAVRAADKTYDGTAVEVTVTKTGTLENTDIPVVLTKDGAAFTGDPVNAGDYTASITFGGVTASVDFTIAKKQVTATVTVQDKIYNGDTAADVSAALENLVLGDSINITGLLGTFSDAGAGENKTVTIDSSNVSVEGTNADCYEITYPTTAMGTITKAGTPTITFPNASAITFGQTLENATLSITSNDYGTFAWADTTVKPNAGTHDYTVKFTASEEAKANYEITDLEQSVRVVVNPAKVTRPVADTTPFTYNGNEQTYTVAENAAYTISNNKRTDAGEQTVTVALNDKENYTWDNNSTEDVTFTFNIAQKNISGAEITLGTALTYNGNEQSQTVTSVKIDGLDVTYDISGNTATNYNDGGYTLTVTGNGNFTGAATIDWNIARKSVEGATVGTFDAMTYIGNAQTPSATVTIDGLTVTGAWSNVTNVADKTTFTANGNFTGTIENQSTGMLTADSSVTTAPSANTLTYSATAQELVTAGVANGGTLKYSIDNTTWTEAIPTGIDADNYEVWYKVFGDANHNDTDAVKVDVTIAMKSIEDATVALAETLTYNGAEQTQNVTVTLDGFTVTYDVTDNKATNVKADGNYTLKVAAKGNFEGEKTLDWNIAKADHIIEGENIPTASRIRRGNKLSASTITPTELKDADGNVLGTFAWVTPDDEMTETGDFVKQVKFTPTDTNNYNEKIFDVTVNVYRPSSGGGGGSNTSTTTTKNEDGSTTKTTTNKSTGTVTEVTTNTDGSTTTVETKKDGTVTTTEKDKDGNTVTTVEKPDGTSTTTEKNKDGSEKVTEEKADGTTVTTEKDTDGTKTVTTENPDGSRATEETKKDGIKVTTETTADGETKTEIDLPKDKETEVTISVPDAEDVTSITLTDKDGNETEITDFEITEDGVKVTVSGDCTAVINKAAKKEFADVHPVNHWAIADVDYVFAKGLMNGTSETTFAPNDNLTRAMLVTVLYRLEGEPATNRSIPFADVDMGAYYGNAVSWAKQNGIVNGVTENEFAPNDNITREQIAAIMHRYAQYKGYDVTVGENTNILSYDDFADISEYAIPSMQWAVGSGMIKGRTESTLNPEAFATRVEIAAMLHRFIEANK